MFDEHSHRHDRLAKQYEEFQAQAQTSQEAAPALAALHSFRARKAWTFGQHGEAQANFLRSIDAWHEAARAAPASIGARRALMASMISYLHYLQSVGKPEPVLEFLQAAEDMLAEIWPAEATSLDEAYERSEITRSLASLGARLAAKNRGEQAALVYKSAANIAGKISAAYATVPEFRFKEASYLRQVGRSDAPTDIPARPRRPTMPRWQFSPSSFRPIPTIATTSAS